MGRHPELSALFAASGFVDTLLGQLIAHLKAARLYEKSLIVVTADHGVSFRPHDNRRSITETNFADIMTVPLFVKAPFQQRGEILEHNVETIDILPTIADILDIRLPWSVDGDSASPAAGRNRFLFHKSPWICLTPRSGKRSANRPTCFHLIYAPRFTSGSRRTTYPGLPMSEDAQCNGSIN